MKYFLRAFVAAVLGVMSEGRALFAEQPVIGVSAPLSGGGAGWGNDVRNTLIFANEKLTGGRYRFVFEDDRCEPKAAVTAAHKLAVVDKVPAVLLVCGQTTINTTPIYRRRGVLVVSSLSTPSRISGMGAFRTSISDALAAKMLAEHIAATDKTLGAITEEDDYAVSFLQDFIRAAKPQGMTVIEEQHPLGTGDFRALLLRYKAKGVSALFLNSQTEDSLAALLRQLHELKMKPRLFGAYLPGSARVLSLAGSSADGLSFVDFPTAEELLTEEGKSLFDEYVARFGEIQGWSFAFPATFEAFRVIDSALQSGESPEEFLKGAKFEGIFGSYSFDDSGDIVGPKPVMRIIRGGRHEAL